MKETTTWFYDESKHCGVDYSDTAIAGEYDERHGKFRDFQEETKHIIELLGLKTTDTVIDLGCGTGGITVYLAQHVKTLHAVDISQAMLQRCRDKCTQAGLSNVEFHQGGFLNYEHKAEPVDAIISQVALHHLPDMWKQVAMLKCYDMLKPGGVFMLLDVVFSFAPRDYESVINEWVDIHTREVGSEAATHIKDEYSTMDWVMEGILERAGFVIEQIQDHQSFIKVYVCRKPV
jgi:ubiquinone/menaquinone biosynthesis C-methylase UbiE